MARLSVLMVKAGGEWAFKGCAESGETKVLVDQFKALKLAGSVPGKGKGGSSPISDMLILSNGIGGGELKRYRKSVVDVPVV